MGWQKGRTAIDQMLRTGELERIHDGPEHAAALVRHARARVDTAREHVHSDPPHACRSAYDGAQSALLAVLASQGLQPPDPEDGQPPVLYEAVRAQLVPPLGGLVRPYTHLRGAARRAEVDPDTGADPAEARLSVQAADDLVEVAEKVMGRMEAF